MFSWLRTKHFSRLKTRVTLSYCGLTRTTGLLCIEMQIRRTSRTKSPKIAEFRKRFCVLVIARLDVLLRVKEISSMAS
jgi:hypothetical protein